MLILSVFMCVCVGTFDGHDRQCDSYEFFVGRLRLVTKLGGDYA
jgi:hypothetical protein